MSKRRPNNLDRPRPDEWEKNSLFPFIEECWSNSVGVVGNNNVSAARLGHCEPRWFPRVLDQRTAVNKALTILRHLSL